MSLKGFLILLKDALVQFFQDRCPRLAAALAFYTLFSLVPILVIVIGVAGLFLGTDRVRSDILNQFSGLIGNDNVSLIEEIFDGLDENTENSADEATENSVDGGDDVSQVVEDLVSSSNFRGGGARIAALIGLAFALFAATAVFHQMQDSLNHVWGIRPKPDDNTVLRFILIRILSFGMILVVSFLLLVALVLNLVLDALSRRTNDLLSLLLDELMPNLPGGLGAAMAFLVNAASILLSLAIITVLFALIFKYLPDARIKWRDVWVGSFVTAVLFTIGEELIGTFLGNSSFGQIYAGAAALAIILLWVYFSAQILYYGAEVTWVYANRYGSHIRPARYAMAVPKTMDMLSADAATDEQGI